MNIPYSMPVFPVTITIRTRKKDNGGHDDDQVPTLVHTLRDVLAARPRRARCVSDRMAAAAAVKAVWNSRERRAGIVQGDRVSTGATSRATTRSRLTGLSGGRSQEFLTNHVC